MTENKSFEQQCKVIRNTNTKENIKQNKKAK